MPAFRMNGTISQLLKYSPIIVPSINRRISLKPSPRVENILEVNDLALKSEVIY